MADRRDYYFRQKVTEAELDSGFDDLEQADRDLATDLGLVGVAYGLAVAEQGVPNLTVQVSGPGAAYDQTGQRAAIPSTQSLNCAVDEGGLNTAVVTPGNSRVLSVFIEFDRTLSDPRVDGNSNTVYFVRAESFVLNVVAGVEGVSPTAPALRSDQILLADITIAFGATTIVNANISTTRRQWMFKTTSGAAVACGTAEEAIQALAIAITAASGTAAADLAAHVASGGHAAANISYAGGGAWADASTNPATTVEAQLDKIVADLAASTGTLKIGGAAFDGGNFDIVADGLASQIGAIVTQIGSMRPSVWRVDHTTFWGTGWTAGGGASGNETRSSADLGSGRFPITNLPPGATIASIAARIDPGGTRADGAPRTQMGLFRIDQNGTASSVQALTAEPAANGDAIHTWTLALGVPHAVIAGSMYYIAILAGDDGGVHSPDSITSLALNLTY
jgi:hypothetical protein